MKTIKIEIINCTTDMLSFWYIILQHFNSTIGKNNIFLKCFNLNNYVYVVQFKKIK